MPTTATTNYGMTYTFNGSAIGSCQIIEYPEVSTGVVETTNHAGGGVAERADRGRTDPGRGRGREGHPRCHGR